jgi:hypothetical protein
MPFLLYSYIYWDYKNSLGCIKIIWKPHIQPSVYSEPPETSIFFLTKETPPSRSFKHMSVNYTPDLLAVYLLWK